jgi:integrase
MNGCRPLTDAEVELVRKTFAGRYAARDRCLFILGIETGFRISELLSVRLGDVWRHGSALHG